MAHLQLLLVATLTVLTSVPALGAANYGTQWSSAVDSRGRQSQTLLRDERDTDAESLDKLTSELDAAEKSSADLGAEEPTITPTSKSLADLDKSSPELGDDAQADTPTSKSSDDLDKSFADLGADAQANTSDSKPLDDMALLDADGKASSGVTESANDGDSSSGSQSQGSSDDDALKDLTKDLGEEAQPEHKLPSLRTTINVLKAEDAPDGDFKSIDDDLHSLRSAFDEEDGKHNATSKAAASLSEASALDLGAKDSWMDQELKDIGPVNDTANADWLDSAFKKLQEKQPSDDDDDAADTK